MKSLQYSEADPASDEGGPLTQFPLVPVLLLLVAGMSWSAAQAQPSPAPAPAQWVQVIVFRSLDPDAGRHERWSHHLPVKLMQAGLPLSRHAGGSHSFRPASLGPRMQRVWALLRAAALYAPMLKVAWIQPALNLDAAIPVALNPVRGKRTSFPGPATTSYPVPGFAHPGLHSSRAPLKPEVFGTVKITVLRHVYIAVHTALVERPPDSISPHPHPGQSAQTPRPRSLLNVYPIHQANQVRPGRINYFDNPAYGVLVYVKAVPAKVSSKPPPG